MKKASKHEYASVYLGKMAALHGQYASLKRPKHSCADNRPYQFKRLNDMTIKYHNSIKMHLFKKLLSFFITYSLIFHNV